MQRDPRAFLWDVREAAAALESFPQRMDAAAHGADAMASTQTALTALLRAVPTLLDEQPGPVAGPLQLAPVNAAVVSVHTADGAHVGSLKRVGGVWKFKAMGYDAAGRMEPGHGPLTEQHNMAFATLDAEEVSARLLGALAGGPDASA